VETLVRLARVQQPSDRRRALPVEARDREVPNAIILKLNLTEAMDASVSRCVEAALLYLAERGDS
jgi:hypothetical protein